MVNEDEPLFEVQVFLGKAVQLTDPQPGAYQDHNIVVVIILSILLNKTEIIFLLLLGECRSFHRIIRNNIGHLKFERIFANHVIIDSHFEGGP